MHPDLANKPLVEALLELHWFPESVPPPVWKDEAYPVFVGPFFESIRADYPIIEQLDPAQMLPDQFTPGVVKYRFRRAPNDWPLVQVGPGVATINFGTSYNWSAFKSAARVFVNRLIESYQVKGAFKPPFFSWALLRFINAHQFDAKSETPFEFATKKLHAELALPDAISTHKQIGDAPRDLDVRLTYPSSKPVGEASIRIASGLKDERLAVLWDLSLLSRGSSVPRDSAGIVHWVSDAHTVLEDWFFTLIEGELLELYRGDVSVKSA